MTNLKIFETFNATEDVLVYTLVAKVSKIGSY